MRRAQIIGFSIAGIAGLIDFVGILNIINQKPKIIETEKTVDTIDILVAHEDLKLGDIVSPNQFVWKKWPKGSVALNYIKKENSPDATNQFVGSIVHSTIHKNEPIIQSKLINYNKGGFLSSILPKGKRATSVKITDYSAAGKLIAPNDHVDVLSTINVGTKVYPIYRTETILQNIRILAIGKELMVEDIDQDFDGKVAVLELTPAEVEKLTLDNVKSEGKITLALRSITDNNDPNKYEKVNIIHVWGK